MDRTEHLASLERRVCLVYPAFAETRAQAAFLVCQESVAPMDLPDSLDPTATTDRLELLESPERRA